MKLIIYLLFSFSIITTIQAQKWKRLQDIRGVWKFSIGDKIEWSNPEYNDNEWTDIFVPSAWENEGYPGYDGYAWYRKSFKIDKKNKYKNLYLHLGYIDDVDQVYVNGKLIGFSGSFPPYYSTAYHLERYYRLPEEVLNFSGDNIIAVRIFDRELSGGILRGRVGIYEKIYDINIEIPLEGIWKFKIGDNQKYKNIKFTDKNWKDIFVPDTWEQQGFSGYDGYGWYRKTFVISEKYKGQKLVLLLGKIDDLDETFLNGHKIGSTGRLYNKPERVSFSDEWLITRAYILNEDYIKFNQENILAVRVFDGMVDGGIYQGPVGIVTYDNYIKWKPEKKDHSKSFFEWLFGED